MADAAHIIDALARLRQGDGPAPEQADAEADRRLLEARAKRRRGSGLQLNLTPMIDVTFLLLVFFVCTTKALDKEGLLRADLSERGGIVGSDALTLEEPPLRIEVRVTDGRTALRVMAPASAGYAVRTLVGGGLKPGVANAFVVDGAGTVWIFNVCFFEM